MNQFTVDTVLGFDSEYQDGEFYFNEDRHWVYMRDYLMENLSDRDIEREWAHIRENDPMQSYVSRFDDDPYLPDSLSKLAMYVSEAYHDVMDQRYNPFTQNRRTF